MEYCFKNQRQIGLASKIISTQYMYYNIYEFIINIDTQYIYNTYIFSVSALTRFTYYFYVLFHYKNIHIL